MEALQKTDIVTMRSSCHTLGYRSKGYRASVSEVCSHALSNAIDNSQEMGTTQCLSAGE